MCMMHYQRFIRNGDPLRKKRARGVMDAPVIYPLGPLQTKILETLVANPGRTFSAETLHTTKKSVQQAVARIRQNHGQGAIDTVLGKGYRLSERFRRLQEMERQERYRRTA